MVTAQVWMAVFENYHKKEWNWEMNHAECRIFHEFFRYGN